MIIKNSILPPKGFNAMAIFPFIFVRNDIKITDRLINHEEIHLLQESVLILVSLFVLIPVIWYFLLTPWLLLLSYSPFYILYGIFYLIYGYRNNPFEKEAYDKDDDLIYLDNINLFAWIKYL
jgi:Ca2+/Na+ antiporter